MAKITGIQWLKPWFEFEQDWCLEIDGTYYWEKHNILEKIEIAQKKEYDAMLEFANWCRVYEHRHRWNILTIEQLYDKYIKHTEEGNISGAEKPDYTF